MVALVTRLPGGLVLDGQLQKTVVFHEITGALENRLLDAGRANLPLPARVTERLLAVCATIGGRTATRAILWHNYPMIVEEIRNQCKRWLSELKKFAQNARLFVACCAAVRHCLVPLYVQRLSILC